MTKTAKKSMNGLPEVSKETIDEVKDEMDKALRFFYPNLDYVEDEDAPATESTDSTENSEEVETDEPVALARVGILANLFCFALLFPSI